jgi:hypothetical protein
MLAGSKSAYFGSQRQAVLNALRMFLVHTMIFSEFLTRGHAGADRDHCFNILKFQSDFFSVEVLVDTSHPQVRLGIRFSESIYERILFRGVRADENVSFGSIFS